MYATINDMTTAYDARIIGDLVSDDGTRVTALAGNTVLTALLDQSAGVINSAIFVGGRYTAANMAVLTDDALAFLTRLNVNGAFVLLKMRRGHDVTEDPVNIAWQEDLTRLRLGERIFDVAANKVAHNMDSEVLSAADISSFNFLSDYSDMFTSRRLSTF